MVFVSGKILQKLMKKELALVASKLAHCLHTGNIGDEFKISLFVQSELTSWKTEIKETFSSQNTDKHLSRFPKIPLPS